MYSVLIKHTDRQPHRALLRGVPNGRLRGRDGRIRLDTSSSLLGSNKPITGLDLLVHAWTTEGYAFIEFEISDSLSFADFVHGGEYPHWKPTNQTISRTASVPLAAVLLKISNCTISTVLRSTISKISNSIFQDSQLFVRFPTVLFQRYCANLSGQAGRFREARGVADLLFNIY